MTVPTTTSSVQYTGTGVVDTYDYTWQIVDESDLIVYTTSADGLTITQLVLNTDYTVTGVGVFTGGTIVLDDDLASGVVLFIASDPEQIQQLLLQQGATFNPAAVMAALDLLCRQVQANRRLIEGSVRFPVSESLDDLTSQTPGAVDRANTTLAFDADGNVTLGGGLSDIVISAAMTPVVQAATLALARAAMEVLWLGGGTMFGAINMGGFKITNLGAPVSDADATTKEYVDDAIAAAVIGSEFPLGAVIHTSDAVVPSAKWKIANGDAISRTTYAAYFAMVGEDYGPGDGMNTFNIPNVGSRGIIAVGPGGGGLSARVLASTGGAETHTLTVPEMPAHTHTLVMNETDAGVNAYPRQDGNDTSNQATTDSTGGGGAHNNMQPFITLTAIVRVSL